MQHVLHRPRLSRPSWIALLAGALVLTPVAGAAADDPAATATSFRVRDFVLDGLDPAQDPAPLLAALSPYRSDRATLATLEEAARTLEAEWQRQGRLCRVTMPPQDLTDGVVHLRVQAVTLRRLESADQALLTDERAQRMLPTLVEGQSPDLRAVARSVALVNDNPARQATLSFRAVDGGAGAGDQVDVVAQPRRVASDWIGSLELNNQGPLAPSHWRLQAVLANANLFDLGHVASVTYTTAPSAVHDVRQYGAFYTAPWYATGISLSAYAFRSTSRTGSVGGLIDVSGVGRFAGVAMKQRLLGSGNWTSTWNASLDDKRFDNGSTVQGTNTGSIVRSRPLALGATSVWEDDGARASFGAQGATNLTGGNANSDTAYAATRANSRADWQALRLNADGSLRLASGAAWIVRASGQTTHQALISGEQFGIGGPDSIRAYEPRQFNGDRGWQASAELWSPEWLHGWHALAFVDAGRVYAVREDGAPRPGAIAAGAGVRWSLGSRVSLTADFAHALSGVGGASEGARRLYVALDMRMD